ncbi:hypothetical protein EJD97_018740 [Solanum chilense]|uniref:Uncharacterized protein n=1 Tax=Solanum chilense TaxID=4083 RepID=A0A6N2B2U0_SOLCI|nr:hypothetical protein EJD97_018740 [Solanum chilense]
MNKKLENEDNKQQERGGESEPPDKQYKECRLSTIPDIDEYEVCNSQDEVDGDNKSVNDQQDDDETIESLIRAFSPQNDQSIEDEIQQATQTQGLSPRDYNIADFFSKNKILQLSLQAYQTLGYFGQEHPND